MKAIGKAAKKLGLCFINPIHPPQGFSTRKVKMDNLNEQIETFPKTHLVSNGKACLILAEV